MASTTVVDGDDEKSQCSSHSKQVVSEYVEDAQTSLKAKQAESGQDSYDSDSGDSDCSVTSVLNGHLHERIAFFTSKQAGHSTAGESGEITWTDEKHSSYLDSMEATFVQKMYDKEYCSLDVCGNSSHSSLTLDQECVESQPVCLNMRKPLERKITELLKFKVPARPLAPVASSLTSPWIQHFKAQRNVSLEKARFQDKDAQPAKVSAATKVLKETHAYSSLSEGGPQSSHGSAYDSARVSQAAEYKKCQQYALSHMDIQMEQQYNLEQHRKMEKKKGGEDGQDPKGQSENHQGHKKTVSSCKTVALLQDTVLKEKQELGLPPAVVKGFFPQKLDQVVPSHQNVGEEACAKVLLADLQGDEEDAHCTTMPEPELISNPSGSKTWTWSIQGPRYQVVKQTSALAFHS